MSKAETKPHVPAALKTLMRGYVNTCRVMSTLWFRTMLILLVALPLGIRGTGQSWVEAAISGIGLWILVGAISRFLVFEFRHLRAGWVARKIERRIPRGHPSREVVIEWIREHQDGDYLNTVLKKLGEKPGASHSLIAPLQRAVSSPKSAFERFAANVLGGSGLGGQSESVQTHVFTTTQTQMLNEDGEWVTVQSTTSSDGDGVPPSEAIQKALAMLGRGSSELVVAPHEEEDAGPPPGFEPIPLSPPTGAVPGRKKGRRKPKRLSYMPLEVEDYTPREEDDDEKAEPAACSSEDQR